MLRGEKKILSFLEKNKDIIAFTVISIIGLIIRYTGREFISDDMKNCLIPWYEQLKQRGGIHALKKQTGNYNILYQTIIACFTYIKVNCIYMYKIVSIVFDYLMAYSTSYFICKSTQSKIIGVKFNIMYAVILCLPTVVLNSGFWGQCDSIYTAFALLAIFYLYKGKYTRSFIFLGIAFAFKIQTIFIVPFIICYYMYKKEFSITMFLVSVATFWLSGFFGFIMGRSLLDPFTIYARQTSAYEKMYSNVTSFWILVGDKWEYLKNFGILIVILLCGIGLYVILSGYKLMDSVEEYLNTAGWFVWVCILFLPAMHERYTYMLDILLIALAFLNPKYIKYAAISTILSLITYTHFLFRNGGVDKYYVLVYLGAWMHYTYVITKTSHIKKTS